MKKLCLLALLIPAGVCAMQGDDERDLQKIMNTYPHSWDIAVAKEKVGCNLGDRDLSQKEQKWCQLLDKARILLNLKEGVKRLNEMYKTVKETPILSDSATISQKQDFVDKHCTVVDFSPEPMNKFECGMFDYSCLFRSGKNVNRLPLDQQLLCMYLRKNNKQCWQYPRDIALPEALKDLEFLEKSSKTEKKQKTLEKYWRNNFWRQQESKIGCDRNVQHLSQKEQQACRLLHEAKMQCALNNAHKVIDKTPLLTNPTIEEKKTFVKEHCGNMFHDGRVYPYNQIKHAMFELGCYDKKPKKPWYRKLLIKQKSGEHCSSDTQDVCKSLKKLCAQCEQ